MQGNAEEWDYVQKGACMGQTCLCTSVYCSSNKLCSRFPLPMHTRLRPLFVSVLYHLKKESLSVLPLPRHGMLQSAAVPLPKVVKRSFSGIVLQ